MGSPAQPGPIPEAPIPEAWIRGCVSVLATAAQPLSMKQIRELLPADQRFPEKSTSDVADALRRLPPEDNVHAWPDHARQRNLFWNRTLGDAVHQALMEALDSGPLTAARAALAIDRKIPKTGAKRRVEEARAQLRILSAGQQLLLIERLYFSPAYLKRLAGGAPSPLAAPILEAIPTLESAPGNYVAVSQLRSAIPLRRAFDEAVLTLARRGELVLAEYDGPRPLPPEREADYVASANGRLYLGVARPRSSEAGGA